MLQLIADGFVIGSVIALGAIGVTLVYSILRFANFAHGELLTWGAYLAWTALLGFAAGWVRVGLLLGGVAWYVRA